MNEIQSLIDAQRGAVAAALAAIRGDREGFVAIVRNASNQGELVWRLALLPAAVALGVARHFDCTLDLDEALDEALRDLPILAEELDDDNK